MKSASIPLWVKLLLPFVMIPLVGIHPTPRLIQDSLEQAHQAGSLGDSLTASKHIALAASRFPWRVDLWEQAATLALLGNEPALAQEFLQQALKVGPLTTEGKITLGEAASKLGNLEAAIQIWEQLQESGNAPAEVHYQLALAYRQSEDYPASAEQWSLLATIFPAEAWVNYQLGLTLAAIQPEAALAYLNQAAAQDRELVDTVQIIERAVSQARFSGDQAHMLTSSGQALAQLGEWGLAAEAFRRATVILPIYAEAWAFLGEAQQHLGKESLTSLETAISLDPQSVAANTFIALYWQRQKQYDLALGYLDKASRIDPINPALQVELGNTMAVAGNLAAAAGYYQQAVDLAPRDATYWLSLTAFSLKYDYLVEQLALPAAQQALELTPDDPAALDTLGQVYILLNDLPAARRYLEEALQKDIDFAPAYLHLGLVFTLLGDATLGKQYLEMAHEKAKGDADVIEQAERLLHSYFGK